MLDDEGEDKNNKSNSRLVRRLILLLFATIIIWICGWDEWLEYYIELGIYHYKVAKFYGGGLDYFIDLWNLNFLDFLKG